MSPVFANPLASVAVFVTWLVLAGDIGPAQLLFAAVLALLVPMFSGRFIAEPVVVRRVNAAMRLAGVVLWDIVVANLAVARLVLGPTARLRPVFVEVPLDTSHPYVVPLLASIVTMTPGTVSCEVYPQGQRLLVHVLDADDPAAVAADIKSRYEQPLKEIFGC
ncbi:MAG: Na+/H+ antiporter subunit E [Burkholderiales bacterium]